MKKAEEVRRLERDRIKNNIVVTSTDAKGKSHEDIIHAEQIGTKIITSELENTAGKERVMKNKHKQLQERIFINNKLTWEEREKRKKMKQRMEEEKKKGRTANMGYQKITIDGKQWK
ncbi:hypothetical protein ILUMI_06152 [Ignelater luminosus]|uniref:Uncharacterized protein n=1 Tax=Ignelater luminosus TaxID=2038154 RepID=A0A8K0DB89_IGNLU|nr:hypothetical protein ILUMI_06152 [Ignelater luminosus]